MNSLVIMFWKGPGRLFTAACLILLLSTMAWADDPLQLVMDGTYQTATSHHYVGQDVPNFVWPIYFKDYYNDEWRMKKVREYGGVEYYVGNRFVPSNGKRYACSASVYHSPQGDTFSFASQNWQKEKSFVYNVVRQNSYHFFGCEYWLGADRWDSYYFRNAWIDLVSGEFGGQSRSAQTASSSLLVEDASEGVVAGMPEEVWANEDTKILEMRLEPDRFKAVMEARAERGIE